MQGVGFRPFVHALAGRLGLAGLVGNDAGGVFVEVEGGRDGRAVPGGAGRRGPAAGRDRAGDGHPAAADGGSWVRDRPSEAGGERQALVSPDTATCADCLQELADPADRRYRYPFVNCTNCGPRFTIIRDVPYDRPATTMAGFEMCADCAREYHDPPTGASTPSRCAARPAGRRWPCSTATGGRRAQSRWPRPRPGCGRAVVAVRGLGGYHLAADAASEPAVAALRACAPRGQAVRGDGGDLDAARALPGRPGRGGDAGQPAPPDRPAAAAPAGPGRRWRPRWRRGTGRWG